MIELPKILAKGCWGWEKVNISEETVTTRKIDKNVEDLLDKYWLELQENSLKNNKQIWDSLLYRLENISINDISNDLSLTLSTINFSTRKAITNYLDRIMELGEDYFSKGMFSSIFVETKDNKFCFLKNSGKFETRNTYSFPGGAISKSEQLINSGNDLFLTAFRELNEELNISDKDFNNLRLISIYLTIHTHICCLFYLKLDLTQQQLEEIYNSFEHSESSEIIFLNFDEIKDFLSQNIHHDIIKYEVLDFLKREKIL